MKITDFLIAMVVVGVVVVCLYTFEIELASNPQIDIDVNTSYVDTYNKVTEIMKETNRTQTEVMAIAKETDKSFFTGTWDAFVIFQKVVFGVATITGGGISLFVTMLADFSDDIGLPPIAFPALLAIITILLIGALLFLLLKRRV